MTNILSISLDDEDYALIKRLKENGLNLSSWAKEMIKNNLSDVLSLEQRKEALIKEINKISKDIELLQKYEVKEQPLTNKEINFFKESKRILEKNPEFLNGRINLYNNTFLKSITKKSFLEELKNKGLQFWERKEVL